MRGARRGGGRRQRRQLWQKLIGRERESDDVNIVWKCIDITLREAERAEIDSDRSGAGLGKNLAKQFEKGEKLERSKSKIKSGHSNRFERSSNEPTQTKQDQAGRHTAAADLSAGACKRAERGGSEGKGSQCVRRSWLAREGAQQAPARAHTAESLELLLLGKQIAERLERGQPSNHRIKTKTTKDRETKRWQADP